MSVEAPPAAPPPLERPLGTPIKGPAAIGVDAHRFINLTRTLAFTEFKLRFFGSALGYLWQLMRPLLLFGVLYAVFTQVLRFDTGAKYYPVALLSGIVFFMAFSESTGAAVTSLVDRENLVRKVQFPRLVVPLSVVLTALMNLSLNLIAVIVFLLGSGGSVRLSWLELPLLIVLLALFSSAISTLLSAMYVRYRDVKPIWDVLLQMLFYGTPIFYTIDAVGNRTLEQVLMCNPLAVVIQQFRHAVIDPSHPSAATAIGGWPMMLIPAGILLALSVFAFRYFDNEAPRVAEDL
jgi:ABC-2 type transport system permease protein